VRKLNPTLIALLGGVAVLLGLLWLFAGNRGADQDKLTGNELTQAAAPANPGKLCASPTTYDFIKRDLFRRAAQLRGSDQAAYDKLAAYAVVRMENPVLESEDNDTGALNCSGSLSLDLPPGVAIVGGRRTLTADVDYTIQRAADGSGTVIMLRNADAIVAPLAALARVAGPSTVPDLSNSAVPVEPVTNLPVTASPAQPAPVPPESTGARPSFDCANARSSGETAVCADSGLATLDRNMAAQFSRSLAGATPAQSALLRQTRDRFLAFRDRCPTRACISDAYVGRMREIRDIMEGRWQPPR
jgi:uncharacterized protein YecT (DUF1311 family)